MSRVKAALDNEGKSPLAVCLEFKMNDWQGSAELLKEAYKVRGNFNVLEYVLGKEVLKSKLIYTFRVHMIFP